MQIVWNTYYPDVPCITFPISVKNFERVPYAGKVIDCEIDKCPDCNTTFAVPYAVTGHLDKKDDEVCIPCPGCGTSLVI